MPVSSRPVSNNIQSTSSKSPSNKNIKLFAAVRETIVIIPQVERSQDAIVWISVNNKKTEYILDE